MFSLSKTLSGLYCLIIISVYISVTVNKLTHSNLTVPEVEVEFLMCYLYTFSSMFLLYILLYLARIPSSFDNIKSHGSGFLRQGQLFLIQTSDICQRKIIVFFLYKFSWNLEC